MTHRGIWAKPGAGDQIVQIVGELGDCGPSLRAYSVGVCSGGWWFGEGTCKRRTCTEHAGRRLKQNGGDQLIINSHLSSKSAPGPKAILLLVSAHDFGMLGVGVGACLCPFVPHINHTPPPTCLESTLRTSPWKAERGEECPTSYSFILGWWISHLSSLL